MNIQIFGKKKCFDTKKAQRYFKERGIKVQYIDILDKGLSKRELRSIISAVGEFEKLLNEKDENFYLISYLVEEQKEDKLLETPSLYKTPIVRNGKKATVGYQPDIWKQWD
jgi:arsenate reductase-like glutaredoxin family protein